MKKNILLLLCLFIVVGPSCKKDQPTDLPTYQAQLKSAPLPKIIGFNGDNFIDEYGNEFFPWGFNYCNPVIVGLIEDNWDSEDTWKEINGDFQEMSAYGANIVRIHLQSVKFMNGIREPNLLSFQRLERLAQVAEENNIYLLVTGLGCYRLTDQEEWYDTLDDAGRWRTQRIFWNTVAAFLQDYNCVFAYDLINEPVVASGCSNGPCSWYPVNGTFGGYQFVQNISINPNCLYWPTIAEWSDQMTESIRRKDQQTMITLGLLPLGPIKNLAPHYDILSTHIYPVSGNIEAKVNYVLDNQSSKPFLISEIYNLSCSTDELREFLVYIDGYYDGFIGHYFGKTMEEYDTTIMVEYIHYKFLEFFIEQNPN